MAKKKGKVIQMLTPENYIRQKSRTLPIYECWINNEWEETKKASITIARKHTNGNFTVGLFLVDLLCLGVKDAHFKFNITEFEYKGLLEFADVEMGIEKIDYTLAHNIILAGLEFAEDYGFKPHKDFTSTMQYFLEEDSDDIELMNIECGDGDKPMFVRTPYDSDAEVIRIITQLEKTAGFGNFKFVDETANSVFHNDIWDDEEDFDEDLLEEDLFNEVLSIQSPGFQFKIQIQNITKPPVWRRVVVPSHYTFLHFHYIIQSTFGWLDEHLFSFSPSGYGSSPVIKEIDEENQLLGFESERGLEAADVRLSEIFKKEGQKFIYIYDFGDDWHHKITLEKIVVEKSRLPVCLAGKGKCPPEDCGGIWGYENMKEIMSDNKHPEYEEYMEWLELDKNETWDPNEFDLEETQYILSGMFS